MAKRSNESDVWKSCKLLCDGKHASREIMWGEIRRFNICAPETLEFTAPVVVHLSSASLYKQTNVNTNIIEISVILIKQSLYD